MASEPGIVLTIGHSTRRLDEFLDLLGAHGVEELVDVRRFPGSRRNPQFSGETLPTALADADISYLHLPALGGRRGAPSASSPNTGWRVAAFRAYADYMAEPEWLESLGVLEDRARRNRVAYMCAEAVPWRCHRRLISDALVVRGWDVRHILGTNRLDAHVLQDFAEVQPDGSIIYPGDGGGSRGMGEWVNG